MSKKLTGDSQWKLARDPGQFFQYVETRVALTQILIFNDRQYGVDRKSSCSLIPFYGVMTFLSSTGEKSALTRTDTMQWMGSKGSEPFLNSMAVSLACQK